MISFIPDAYHEGVNSDKPTMQTIQKITHTQKILSQNVNNHLFLQFGNKSKIISVRK